MPRLALPMLVALAGAFALTAHAATPTPGIAYATFGAGKETVWSAAIDGSHRVELAKNADQPVISPDGAFVAYQALPSGSGEPVLRVIPSGGGTSRKLAGDLRGIDQDVWSPDSTKLLAEVGPEIGGPHRLLVIDVDSGTTTTIATGFFSGVSWAPTGKQIVYARAAHSYTFPGKVDLYVASPSGGTPKMITHDHRSAVPIWGPEKIVFQRYDATQPKNDNPKANLWTVSPSGAGVRRLTHLTPGRFLTGLAPIAWSDDGTRLLAQFGGQDTEYAQTVSPTTGAAKTVGPRTNDFVGMALSHDGSTVLAAEGGYDPNGKHAIVTFPYAGGAEKTLIAGAYDATWTR